MPIAIRPLTTHDQLLAVEQLQRDAWGVPEVDVVPLHMLITPPRHGGLLLGAFDGERLAGFVFGFLGLTAAGQLKHCSHMAGVHPDYRDHGVGYQLKLAQREHVLAQGLDLITWTFDPLETRNAQLNFHKLGVICHSYIRNLYGPMRAVINAGPPSDRFEVEWWIRSPRVLERVQGGEVSPSPSPSLGGRGAGGDSGSLSPRVLERVQGGEVSPSPSPSLGGRGAGGDSGSLSPRVLERVQGGEVSPSPSPSLGGRGAGGDSGSLSPRVLERVQGGEVSPSPSPSLGGRGAGGDSGSLSPRERVGVREDRIFIEVPTNFQAIKQADMPLAIQWRLRTRQLFEDAFSQGYTVTDLLRHNDRCHYLLEQFPTHLAAT
jgi:predicted GNAT superfamily acetyltransferase